MLLTLSFRHGETCSEMSIQEKVKSRLRCCATFSFRREKVLPEHGDLRYFLEMRADRVRRERVAQTKLSEAEDHTRRLLEEQKDYLLSEAPNGVGQARIEGPMRRQSSS